MTVWFFSDYIPEYDLRMKVMAQEAWIHFMCDRSLELVEIQ